MSFIKISNVHKYYSGHNALNDVSFEIPQKSIFGLLGPNGAGKTTLIRILTQITAPDKGTIYFDGKPLSDEHIKSMGYLPEERGLYSKMKVKEQLVYLARLKGLSKEQAITNALKWLKKLKIDHKQNALLTDLSKGMQQKVQFIATVIHEPSLIILDEPFSGFDPVNAELIRKEILKLRYKGATIILSTHRMESVEELCDSIALLHESKLVLNGSIESIKARYRRGKVLLVAKGDPEDIGVQAEVKDGIFEAELPLHTGQPLNEIIQGLIGRVEILSIEEKHPTINDIFLEEVRGGDYE